MNLNLVNKRFLVTGGSRGIGKAIACNFLNEGAQIIITARSQESLTAVTKDLKAKYGEKKVLHFPADSTSRLEMDIVKNKILKSCDQLDGVVANVGDGRSVLDPIPEYSQWEKIWSINFESALITSRTFLPLLQKSKGCLLFISSITGVEALGAPVDYSTAKAALNAFAKNLSRKVAPNVRVNVIALGNIYFPGGTWDKKLEKDEKSVKAMIKKTVPIQRFGKPGEIADVAVFLCSDRASFITGSVLRVDGGQTVSL